MFNFTSTASGLWPQHMVWSPDQTLVMTHIIDPIVKLNIKDGSAVYEEEGLFLLALLTSELFFYCKLEKMEISSVEQAGIYHFNWLELVI